MHTVRHVCIFAFECEFVCVEARMCMCVFVQVYVSGHASVHVTLDLISCSRLGVYKAEGTMTVCD